MVDERNGLSQEELCEITYTTHCVSLGDVWFAGSPFEQPISQHVNIETLLTDV